MTDQFHINHEMLRRVAEGDERAFYELFRVYAPVLRSYILKSTRSVQDTEEIVQETFIRIWLYRDRLPGLENPGAWLYTVGARVCLNYIRSSFNRQKKMRALEQLEGQPEAEWETPLVMTQLEAIRRDIHYALHRLTDTRRKIYRLNREEGMKPAAIAELLNMPVGTVKNHLSAALKDIREFLTQAGHQFYLVVFILFKIF